LSDNQKMTNTSKLPLVTTLNTADTAKHLASALGGTEAHWAIWLANERKPNRVNQKLAPVVGRGRPRYAADKIDEYVTSLKSVPVKAGQPGQTHGSAKSRKPMPHVSAMKLSEGADPAAVLFVIPKPLTTFILSSEEARHLASRLLNAADEIDAEASE
jgi:hypothetical protein